METFDSLLLKGFGVWLGLTFELMIHTVVELVDQSFVAALYTSSTEGEGEGDAHRMLSESNSNSSNSSNSNSNSNSSGTNDHHGSYSSSGSSDGHSYGTGSYHHYYFSSGSGYHNADTYHGADSSYDTGGLYHGVDYSHEYFYGAEAAAADGGDPRTVPEQFAVRAGLEFAFVVALAAVVIACRYAANGCSWYASPEAPQHSLSTGEVVPVPQPHASGGSSATARQPWRSASHR